MDSLWFGLTWDAVPLNINGPLQQYRVHASAKPAMSLHIFWMENIFIDSTFIKVSSIH
jgi:hypothetical protein